jgi:uncharacterized membrane protein YhaH (DUF805 family)
LRSYFDALMRYFDFSGRTGRASYWIFQIVYPLLVVIAVFVDIKIGATRSGKPDFALTIFFILFHAVPGVSITVRRLHDIGKSGWWYLINFLPLGGFFVLIWTFYPSDPDSNDYGDSDGGSSPRRDRPRRAGPEPYYARALRPSAASARSMASSPRLNGSSERFI